AVYEPTTQGWAIPDYIPEDELSSIEDLKKPEVREKLDGIITGISAGAGLMKDSEKVMEAYDMADAGYSLRSSSEAAMATALSRAIDRDEWIVVTSWSPHWMWQRFELRYLDEPENVFGDAGKVHAIGTSGFDERFPRATALLGHLSM